MLLFLEKNVGSYTNVPVMYVGEKGKSLVEKVDENAKSIERHNSKLALSQHQEYHYFCLYSRSLQIISRMTGWSY